MENYRGYTIKGYESEEFENFGAGTIKASNGGLVYQAVSEAGVCFSGLSMQDAVQLAKGQIDKKIGSGQLSFEF